MIDSSVEALRTKQDSLKDVRFRTARSRGYDIAG
jgi:hypothetical protein